MSFVQQTLTITKKNFRLLFRNKKDIINELAVPIITGLFILVSKNDSSGQDGNIFGSMFNILLPIYLPSTINGFARRHLITFVHEKKERFKETQKIMGLSSEAHTCGWLLTSYVKGVFIIITTLIPIYFSSLMENGFSFSTIALLLSAYVFAGIHQTFAISTLFDSPKLAGEMGLFILSITSLIYYYFTFTEKASTFLYYITLLFPQPALSFALLMKKDENPILNQYSQETAQIMLFFNVIFYFILYLYLEEVIPNEYGINRHPLFFMKKEFWENSFGRNPSNRRNPQSNSTQYQNLIDEDIKNEAYARTVSSHGLSNANPGEQPFQNQAGYSQEMTLALSITKQNSIKSQTEGIDEEGGLARNISSPQMALSPPDFSSAKFHEPIGQSNLNATSVRVDNLAKTFGTLRAVDGVSISLYENQIFCLLGHNGAGKTTMISLLTGMIEKTAGSIKISDKELESDIAGARRLIGLCTQKDVLYDELTVIEHLEFIANIKGISDSQMKYEVDNIIAEVGLGLEKDKRASTLSGGNKRKLSLAMSLTGKSKIIFLDEPTSGMDAVSRQAIWKILDTIRNNQNRCIVLTTHHMDEAERLANRIAIMSQGKLLILGSADYIKSKFGVGYNLTISCKDSVHMNEFLEQKQSIIDAVSDLVPGAALDPQSLKDTIKFLWPFESENTFANALSQLEQNPIVNINLQMNSLEDAFVKIGMEDEMRGESGRETYSNLLTMPKPASLTRLNSGPLFSFKEQLTAMFLRQLYLTTRNWSAMIMIILPVIFNFLSVYIAKHFLDHLKDMIKKMGEESSDQAPIPEIDQLIFTIQMYIFTVLIVQSYSSNSSIYVHTPILERETSMKYILNVMGCRQLPYWLGTFCFDYLAYFSTFLVFFYSIASSDVSFMSPYLLQFFTLMAVFGFAMITFCYLCGFLFSSSNSAFKTFPIFAFFLSYNLPIIVLSICKIFAPSSSKYAEIAFLFISPFIALGKGMGNLNNGQIFGGGDPMNKGDSTLNLFNNWISCVLVLVAQTVIFSILTLLIEAKKFKMTNDNATINQPVFYSQTNLDEGVKREIDRLRDLSNDDPIKVKDLQKVYKNKFHAVQGTTFGVEKGQVFGLLGPNGAGKSTTFNILTANIPKSTGQAQLHGVDVANNPETYFENIGVCPQKNCLWEYLNPIEHMRVFGRLKGLAGAELEDTVNYYNAQMQLRQFTCKSTNLSGGNQRKLCVANSLIGSPSLLFFDEPSTGLDPIAKRYLWRCLRDNLLAKNSAIVLTTHSLQEAEDLCNKIGIQVNGQFMCLDTLQNLKNTKGDGYKFTLKFSPNQSELLVADVQRTVMAQFPNATLLKSIENQRDDVESTSSNVVDLDRMIFKVPSDESFSFSKAFALLHNKLKTEKFIEDFSIAQASLEEIFIHLSSYQITNNDNPSNNQGPNSRPNQ